MTIFSNYAALKTAISTHIDVSDLVSGDVDTLIRLGEAKVNLKLRTRVMETALNTTISADLTLALPSNYQELKSVYLTTDPVRRLKRCTLDYLHWKWADRSSVGIPEDIAREGSAFIFGPVPDSLYTVKGIYYAQPVSMADNGAIHATFSAHPDVYFFAILSEAEPFIGRDSRIAIWEQKWLYAVEAANLQNSDEEHSASEMYVRAV